MRITPLRTFSPTANEVSTPNGVAPSGTFFQFCAAASTQATPIAGTPLRTFSPTANRATTPKLITPSGTFQTQDRGNT